MKDEFKINIIRNKSLTYILPIIDDQVNFKFKSQIINCYTSFNKGDGIFCILYDWKSNRDFLEFEEDMMNHVLFIGHEDYGEKCLYKFKLSRNMVEAKSFFDKGELSKFSEYYKNCIKNYLKIGNVKNIGNILKIMDPKDPRSSSVPSVIQETFINHLTVTKIKVDKLYESNKKKWAISQLQPQQDNL